jgi:hypothetical protein
VVERADELCFIEIEQYDRFLNADDHERLVIAIEYEYFTLECPVGRMKVVVEEVVRERMIVRQTEEGRCAVIGLGISRVRRTPFGPS